MTRLETTQGDLLEFDIHLFVDCEPRPLCEGEEMFFETDKDAYGRSISIRQANVHFEVPAVNLQPGRYPFRAGIIFSTGDRKTVFSPENSELTVRRK